MQLIKITIGDNDRTALVLPVEHAGIAASLLASAKVFERDGYYSTSGWKPAEKGIQIAYGSGDEFEPTHPKVAAAEEALQKKNSDWYDEYRKREAAEKELRETKAALAALQATTVCTRVEPTPMDEVAGVDADTEAEFDGREEAFP